MLRPPNAFQGPSVPSSLLDPPLPALACSDRLRQQPQFPSWHSRFKSSTPPCCPQHQALFLGLAFKPVRLFSIHLPVPSVITSRHQNCLPPSHSKHRLPPSGALSSAPQGSGTTEPVFPAPPSPRLGPLRPAPCSRTPHSSPFIVTALHCELLPSWTDSAPRVPVSDPWAPPGGRKGEMLGLQGA